MMFDITKVYKFSDAYCTNCNMHRNWVFRIGMKAVTFHLCQACADELIDELSAEKAE